MEEPQVNQLEEKIAELNRRLNMVVIICALLLSFCLLNIMAPQTMHNWLAETETPLDSLADDGSDTLVVDGVHVNTGLVVAEGFELIKSNCTNCHGGKLITQNRMTRERWLETIRWMQETQGLWELGENEEIILNYLETNYAPEAKGRRQQLKDIEWYDLEE